VEGHLDFHPPALRMFPAPAEVFDRFVDALHHELLILPVHPEDPASFAAILPGDHLDYIIPTDVHLNDLACQTDNLHKVPLTEFPCHRSKNSRPLGIPLLIDNDCRVAVESDVAPIFPTGRLLRADHHRSNHRPLFKVASRNHTFYAANDNVTYPGIPPPGTP
jgi:hypothetical protein